MPVRVRADEVMDRPDLDPALHAAALRGLARLNRFSFAPSLLWPRLKRLAKETSRPLKILDVATGSGDVPIALLKKAKRYGFEFQITALDRSEVALEQARKLGGGIEFKQADVLVDPLPAGFDAVTCSLFMHHLETDAACLLLTKLADAGRLVLVSDLDRSGINLRLVQFASYFLSRSPVVHVDADLSVRAAFTWKEAKDLAEKAGLVGATVERRFPCRWLLEWKR